MLYSKIILYICLLTFWTFFFCNAKPIKKASKSKSSKKSFLNLLSENQSFKCDELFNNNRDLNKFTFELTYSFLKTGDIRALDNVLKTLVTMECINKEDTMVFRNELIKIYKHIDADFTAPKDFIRKRSSKGTGSKHIDYFDQFSYLIDELEYAYNNGQSEQAEEMIKYIVEYILALEDSHELTTRESNILLGKIRDIVKSNMNSDQENTENLEHQYTEENAENKLDHNNEAFVNEEIMSH